MKVITISGIARHGKDTTAEVLRHELSEMGYSVLITHYADLLKYICTAYFGWNGLKDEEGRTLLQYIGTDVVRKKNPDFWVDYIVSILKMFEDSWDIVLIPDTRFPNEIDKIREAGFETIHMNIVRPNFDNGMTSEQLSHSSETALYSRTPDFNILNDGSVDDLKGKLDKWIKENIT